MLQHAALSMKGGFQIRGTADNSANIDEHLQLPWWLTYFERMTCTHWETWQSVRVGQGPLYFHSFIMTDPMLRLATTQKLAEMPRWTANTARCNSSLIKVKADMRSSTLFNNDARDTFQWFSGMQNCSPASAGIVAYAPCPPVNTMLLDTQSWLKGVKAGWKRQHLLQTSDNSQDVPAMEWRGQQCSSRASFHGLQQHKDFKSNSTATIVIGKQKTSQKQGCVFPVL